MTLNDTTGFVRVGGALDGLAAITVAVAATLSTILVTVTILGS